MIKAPYKQVTCQPTLNKFQIHILSEFVYFYYTAYQNPTAYFIYKPKSHTKFFLGNLFLQFLHSVLSTPQSILFIG